MANTKSSKGMGQVSPRPLALAKGQSGTAGSGSSANFSRATGPKVSPAQMASDSSRQNPMRSNPEQSKSLASRERSQVNRSRLGAPVPQQVVKADSDVGSVAGTPAPRQLNASSSASIQSSSSNATRGEMSSEKGSASVDIGPTKIVADQNSSRTGGGGQPQMSQQSIASESRNNGDSPAIKPSIASTNTGNNVTAPSSSSSASTSTDNPSPNANSLVEQRQSNSTPSIGQPTESDVRPQPGSSQISGSSNNTRSIRSNTESQTGPSLASNQRDQSDQQNPSNRLIAKTPSYQNGSPGSSNQPSPTTSQNQSGLVADTQAQKQTTGTMSVDRADKGSLIQANNASESRMANSSNRRSSRLGSNQVSEMLVGQSNIDRTKLSPVIGSTSSTNDSKVTVAGGGTTESDQMIAGDTGSIGKSSSRDQPSSVQKSTSSAPGANPSQTSMANSSRANRNGSSVSEVQITRAGQGSGTSDAKPMIAGTSTGQPTTVPSMGTNPTSSSSVGNDQIADTNKQSTAGMSVDRQADLGAGGFGNTVDEKIGINSPRASRDSDSIQLQPLSRFKSEDRGNKPQLSSSVVVSAKPFASRRQKRMQAQTPETAKSIELGLAFLARQQNEDGSWSLEKLDRSRKGSSQQLVSDAAATGLALLAFQGAGFNHKEYVYSEKLNRAVKFLIENQKENGDLYIESNKTSNESCRLYSHGIAALALTEAYGMTQDPEIKQAAQKAIDYIAQSQDENFGGWRYYAQPVSMRRSDTSVTGWMVMALQSGRLAGLKVDNKTIEEVERFLGYAKDSKKSYQFRYNPNADARDPKTAKHLKATHSMTAVGLLMQMYLGWDRNDQRLANGADYLLTKLPDDSSMDQRDTYYWYYATQVMNHMGGQRWNKWKAALEPLLIKSQIPEGEMAGSWDPYQPIPDRWGSHGGRIYVTTLNLLSLEVEYRKLPLFVDSGK